MKLSPLIIVAQDIYCENNIHNEMNRVVEQARDVRPRNLKRPNQSLVSVAYASII